MPNNFRKDIEREKRFSTNELKLRVIPYQAPEEVKDEERK
jgi:hypothetical protein